MDNQHRRIKGYRDLAPSDIDLINEIKDEGERLSLLCGRLGMVPSVDGRWVAIGKTNLQQGIMALVRAVAKPESF